MTTSVIPAPQNAAGSVVRVTQAAHGFTQGQAIQMDGATWALAQADDVNTLGVGLADVIDANTFRVVHSGAITGLSGLTAGDYYFVSSATAGALTSTEPVTGFSNPILLATSATAGVVLPYRPSGTGVAETSFIYGYQNTPQTTNLAAGDHIKFDAIYSQAGGDIGLDTTTPYTNAAGVASVGRITLKGGRTYKLSANLRVVITTSGSDYLTAQWYNVSSSTAFGAVSLITTPFSSLNNSNQSTVDATFTPSGDTIVEVRLLGAVGTLTQIYASSVSIETIAATVQPSTTRHEVRLAGQGGWGSTNTRIKYFTTAVSNLGTALTLTQSSVNGDSILVNQSGLYAISGYFQPTVASTEGISVSSTQLTSAIPTITSANALNMLSASANFLGTASWTGWLQAGDVVRWHGSGDTTATSVNNKFEIVKIG